MAGARQKWFGLSASTLRKGSPQEHEQAARDVFHVAVAQAKNMSRAREMLARLDALEKTSRAILDFSPCYSTNHIAGDALENQRRNLLTETNDKVMDLIKNISKKFIHQSEVQNEDQSRQVASREAVANLKHELSQYLVEGAHYQTIPSSFTNRHVKCVRLRSKRSIVARRRNL